jgi:hypothetical protein
MTSLQDKIKVFLENKEDILKLPMYSIYNYNSIFSNLGYTNDGD